MVRILIADDHAIVRAGLKQVISKTADLSVTGEAGSGEDALALLEHGEYDVLVLDLSMPGRGGADALKQIRVSYPDLPVLILSMHPEEQFAVRALKSGASGYLSKESAPEQLVEAIRRVASGRKYVSSSLAEQLAEDVNRREADEPHDALSNRELQVLCMIASGQTVTDIAENLSLSVKTVSTYRERIMDKMRLKNNVELTHYAIKHRLVE